MKKRKNGHPEQANHAERESMFIKKKSGGFFICLLHPL